MHALEFIQHETRSMLSRLNLVRPFVMHEVMVPAASLEPEALLAIESHLARGRRQLRQSLEQFAEALAGGYGQSVPLPEAQRRLCSLRLRFGIVLTQLDLFNDVLSQRSERDTGVWLAGLDAAAADALRLPPPHVAPPVVCYLDRGMGAAIRRARTRLPGGGDNPVATIRVPRERMVGSGIAASLVHEVGHQAAALLGLVGSLRAVAQERWRREGGSPHSSWRYWERWISEIVADLWAVGRLGVAASAGLIGVVSLPRAFVFRMSLDDPHPVPWIRVHVSCALGQAMYPDPQWDALAALWQQLYPLSALPAEARSRFERLAGDSHELAATLLAQRPPSLQGRTLLDVVAAPHERSRARLAATHAQWLACEQAPLRAAPSLAFAVIGQARADGALTPESEAALVQRLLEHWALNRTLGAFAASSSFEPRRRSVRNLTHLLTETS